uniref:Uncharacterized protein n=1 Tax=uncultured Desulfobacterium sp. TaxID=201089 RepID=E1YBI6_9BACT|nr:hypothetical protein N47_G32540 [uncultured Desulfobacterium sp.]
MLSCEQNSIFPFHQLLQSGFIIKATVGCNIREFLCNKQLVENDYLDSRIQTIFLDGKPVDDVDSAIVKDGSTLSLSAAMPGLVGATLRKGGFFAAMRTSISYLPGNADRNLYEGKVIIKLFNLVSKELGPEFLNRGIIIAGHTFSDLIKSNSDIIAKGFISAIQDGKQMGKDIFFKVKWEEKDEIFLQITSL